MKNNFKIDIDLLNSLNDAYCSTHYFSDWAESPEIVPTDLEHKKLLENHVISPDIYNYYNRVNLFEPFTKEQKYINSPILKDRHNSKVTPYNLKICNTYYYRPDFIFKLSSIIYHSPIYSDSKEIKDLLDLKPYFLDYQKGFNKGYVSFEDDKINFLNPAFTDKTDRLEKVFEFITARPTGKKHYWGKLTFTQYNFTTDKEISNAFEDGVLQGYYYKAWTIVFTLNDFFAPLFREFISQTNQQKEIEAVEVKNLHANIFKRNAYEIFEKYHFNKSLTEQSRTDLRAVFEFLKGDSLLVETVELKHYMQWLNLNYGYALNELKKVELKSNPNRQRKNDYNAIKKTTLE